MYVCTITTIAICNMLHANAVHLVNPEEV